MTYTQTNYGSTGSDVKKLQQLLNDNGYNLSVDGVYGDKTRAAVKAYQQANGLTADGIAGDKTWSSLTGFKSGANASTMGSSSGTKATSTTSTASTSGSGGFQYGDYEASDAVKQAEAMLQAQINKKPGEYQSSWQNQLDEIMDQILNRKPFEYDLNGDALYQQYKDQAVQQGRMAMMDTMGQAAAMTGGYGSSYAQSVGQQAYQGHLQSLNDVIPELYQLALNKYTQEGQDMLNQYGMMADLEDQAYGRYRDNVSDWQTERDRLTDQYNTERNYDYSKWSDDRAYAYQTERDKVADEQWKKEFDEAKRQYDQNYTLSASKNSGGSSSGGSSSSKKSSDTTYTKNPGYTKEEILSIQKQAGITQDGIWGPDTAAAYDKGILPKADDTPAAKPTYNSISNELATWTASGSMPKSEISQYINSCVEAGYISQSQAQKLLSTYASKGK